MFEILSSSPKFVVIFSCYCSVVLIGIIYAYLTRDGDSAPDPVRREGETSAPPNIVKLGVYVLRPLVPSFESLAEWAEYRNGIVEAMAPVGAIETCYAEQVASSLWRLRRIAGAEAAWIERDCHENGNRKSQHAIPGRSAMETITHYESHLTRRVAEAMHELRRLQAARNESKLRLSAFDDTADSADAPTDSSQKASQCSVEAVFWLR